MRKSHYFFPILLACTIFLTGCPLSTEYPLADRSNAAKMDKDLIGTWFQADDEAEVTKVSIRKGSSPDIYRVTVLEKGESFMADTEIFDAWITVLNNQKFFVLQEIVGDKKKEVYYVYNITYNASTLTTQDISLNEGGTDAVKSISTYQEEVIASMRSSDFLGSKTTWSKQ